MTLAPPALVKSTLIRVRYAETDQMGVAYYANFLIWFEQARTEYLHALGWPYRQAEERGFYLPVVEVKCRYKAPARYDDLLRIDSRIADYTAIRITMGYQVCHHESGRLLAEGQTVHVWTDRDLKILTMPEDLRTLLIERTKEASHGQEV